MKSPAIVSIGEVLWDLFPGDDELEGAKFGGAPANFACHAAIVGADVMMVSAVGDDQRGRDAVEILQRYGINTSLLQTNRELPTGTVGIELDANGKPTFTIHTDAAWDRIDWNDQLSKTVTSADAICFGTLGQRSEPSRTTILRCIDVARSAGVPRIVDINLRPPFFDHGTIRDSIRSASVLKLSDEELGIVAAALGVNHSDDETTIKRILDDGELDLVVMTRGADGALLVSHDELVRQPGIETEVVDTVGAGDAFTARFVLGLLSSERSEDLLRESCLHASDSCRTPGAVPPIGRTE